MENAASQSVRTLRGVVFDSETGEPIPTVHVYISQTTVGTVTKSDGTFEFSTKLSGVHTLVFSFVGYKTQTNEVNFYEDERLYFEIKLTPDPIELAPLEITASNKEWQENFEIFRKNFIGETNIARNTKINNPWVISFERDEDENLVAKAESPLEIVNPALGYELKVDLVEFRWPKSGVLGYYLFYVSYKELETEKEREMRRWKRNRRDIYAGSFQHFLKSLYDDELKENNFDVVLADTHNQIEIPQVDSLSRGAINLHSGVSGLDPDDVKAYQLRYPVDVLYGQRWFNTNRQRSRIVPIGRAGIFLVTNHAGLANPLTLRLDGTWSTHRLANHLPSDYNLQE